MYHGKFCMLESITLNVELGLAILPDMDMTRNGILGLNSAFVVVSPSLQSSGSVNTRRYFNRIVHYLHSFTSCFALCYSCLDLQLYPSGTDSR